VLDTVNIAIPLQACTGR